MHRRAAAAILLIALLCPPVFAQMPVWPEGEPRNAKWRGFNGMAVGFNPIVFGDLIKIYRVIPITQGAGLLTRDANFRFGGAAVVSPLLFKVGPFVGISPLLICDFDFYWNQYIDPVHIQFDSIRDNYAPHIREERETYWYWGQNLLLSSTFKLAFAGVYFIDILDFEYMYMQDTWFSIEFMTVIDDGFHFNNRMFLMYEFDKGWLVGPMWERFRVFNSGYSRHILNFGMLADRKLPWDMTLILITGYHVENPDFDGLRFWTAVVKEWDF